MTFGLVSVTSGRLANLDGEPALNCRTWWLSLSPWKIINRGVGIGNCDLGMCAVHPGIVDDSTAYVGRMGV